MHCLLIICCCITLSIYEDGTLLVNFVLESTYPTEIEFSAGDINGDGVLNVLDVVQIVNTILS